MKTHAQTVAVALVLLLTLTVPSSPPASAATLTVTNCGDSGDPNQLRQVVAAAAPGDTVDIVCGTVTLTMAASPVSINKNLTITGRGAQKTIIDGGGITQIFRVTGSTASISNMTLRNGNGAPLTLGGAISNLLGGDLTLTNTFVTNNHAFQSGGIENEMPSTLTLVNTSVSGNVADSGVGGGITNNAGGGLTLINSTVSGNTAATLGGGIFVTSGTVKLTNSTISGNTASGSGGFDGGGIFQEFGTVTIKNTIIAKNTGSNGANCQFTGGTLISKGHNIESLNNCGFDTTLDDLINTDPMLGPLQLNGGPTPTHALLPGSPAIDAGDNVGCPATDQRGFPRPLEVTLGFTICDIGAFEVETLGFIQATLSLSTASVRPGTLLQGTVSVTNDGGPRPLDAYLVFVPPAAAGPGFGCPGGDALVFLTGGGARITCVASGVQTFAPFISNVSLPADLFTPVSGSVFSFVWPSGAPTGSWSVALVLTPVGAFADGRVNPTAGIVIAAAGFSAGP